MKKIPEKILGSSAGQNFVAGLRGPKSSQIQKKNNESCRFRFGRQKGGQVWRNRKQNQRKSRI
nr:MAG TPA: hypothetical protein [Caudoviricetes sp.]